MTPIPNYRTPNDPKLSEHPLKATTKSTMNISDELANLQKLHQQGALSEREFAEAKRRVLNSPAPLRPVERDSHIQRPSRPDFLSEVAKQYFLYKAVSGLAGFVFFLVIFFKFLLPMTTQFQR